MASLSHFADEDTEALRVKDLDLKPLVPDASLMLWPFPSAWSVFTPSLPLKSSHPLGSTQYPLLLGEASLIHIPLDKINCFFLHGPHGSLHIPFSWP